MTTVYADDEDLVGAVAVNWPAASLSLRKAFAAGTGADEALATVRALTR